MAPPYGAVSSDPRAAARTCDECYTAWHQMPGTRSRALAPGARQAAAKRGRETAFSASKNCLPARRLPARAALSKPHLRRKSHFEYAARSAVLVAGKGATILDVPAPRKSDPELVEAVRSGGSREFAELYRAHVTTVRAVAASRVGDDPEAVADVVQETFLRALYSLGSLQDATRLRAWLSTIARNLATDHLRNRRRVIALDEPYALDLADTRPGPVHLAELSDLARRVQGCVAGLSRRDATAIALVTHFGFGAAEVAGALGLSAGAAKVLLHRARRRLRQALVLQVMVSRPDLACPELRRILAEEPSDAVRHVQHCDQCIATAASEVAASGSSAPLLRLEQASGGAAAQPRAPAADLSREAVTTGAAPPVPSGSVR